MKHLCSPILLVLIFTVFFSCKNETNTQQAESAIGEDGKYTVNIQLAEDVGILNPMLTRSANASTISRNVFQSLLDFNPKTLKLVPQLAKQMPTEEMENGQFKINYEIKDKAVWSDGKPVTAADFVFTLKVALTPQVNEIGWSELVTFISNVIIDPENPKKFAVYGEEYFVNSLAASGTMQIFPAHIYDPKNVLKNIPLKEFLDPKVEENFKSDQEKNEALAQFAKGYNTPNIGPNAIIGSGPYEIHTWEHNEFIILQKKENYWGDQYDEITLNAYPHRLRYKFIPDPSSYMNAFKSQKIDVASNIPPPTFKAAKENELMLKHYQFHNPTTLLYYFIYLNNQDPLLEDKRVRKALSHAMDLKTIKDVLLDGQAIRTTGPINTSKAYYDHSLEPIPYDIDKAKKLLAEAGWKDTDGDGVVDKVVNGERKRLSLECLITTGAVISKTSAEYLKAGAEKIGVNIDIKTVNQKHLFSNIFPRRAYQIVPLAISQSPVLDDPYGSWHTDSNNPNGSNRSGFGDEASDKLIEELRRTMDEEKRNELYTEFQRIIYEEQPCIFGFNPKGMVIISNKYEAEAYTTKPGFIGRLFKLKK